MLFKVVAFLFVGVLVDLAFISMAQDKPSATPAPTPPAAASKQVMSHPAAPTKPAPRRVLDDPPTVAQFGQPEPSQPQSDQSGGKAESFRSRVETYCASKTSMTPSIDIATGMNIPELKQAYKQLQNAEPTTREGELKRRYALELVENGLAELESRAIENQRECENLVVSGFEKMPESDQN